MSAIDDALIVFSDFDIMWRLLAEFIAVRTDFVDNLGYMRILVKTPFTHDFVPAPDIPHRVECTATGLEFNVIYHSMAALLELSPVNSDWQWLIKAFVKEAEEDDFDVHDPYGIDDIAEVVVADTFAVKGDINKFANYAMLLKLSCSEPDEYCGLKFNPTKLLSKFTNALDDTDVFEK